MNKTKNDLRARCLEMAEIIASESYASLDNLFEADFDRLNGLTEDNWLEIANDLGTIAIEMNY